MLRKSGMKGAKCALRVRDGHPRGPTSSSRAYDSKATSSGGKRSSGTILPFTCSTGKAMIHVAHPFLHPSNCDAS
eukprot:1047921-Rhodomonas_salina.1